MKTTTAYRDYLICFVVFGAFFIFCVVAARSQREERDLRRESDDGVSFHGRVQYIYSSIYCLYFLIDCSLS